MMDKSTLVDNPPAVIWSNHKISYPSLWQTVNRCALQLRERGISENTRVAIANSNCLEYIVALFSLWTLQSIACPLNTRLPESALDMQIRQIKAQRLFLQEISLDPSIIEKDACLSLDYTSNQWATFLFTSGSSARPKVAVHSLRNHYFSALGANAYIPVKPGDRWLLSLPLYHVSGLSILFRTLPAGASLVIPEDTENLYEIIRVNAITHISLVTSQLKLLLEQAKNQKPLTTLKAVLVGGGAIQEILLQQAYHLNLPVYTTYGMTETASQIATGRFPQSARVLPYRELKLADDHELLVRGETLFQGYWIGDRLELPTDKEGWFATGDLGTLDAQGRVSVYGRKDNLFISGGENIQPEEIEELLASIPGVERALVIPIDCPQYGHRPVALIRPADQQGICRNALHNGLSKTLPKYKIPDHYYYWPDELEFVHGKINRTLSKRFIDEHKSRLKPIF